MVNIPRYKIIILSTGGARRGYLHTTQSNIIIIIVKPYTPLAVAYLCGTTFGTNNPRRCPTCRFSIVAVRAAVVATAVGGRPLDNIKIVIRIYVKYVREPHVISADRIGSAWASVGLSSLLLLLYVYLL